MSKRFEFLFDFGGPNSYLVHKILPDFCARTGAEVVYVPILLGGLFKLTNNQPPMMRYTETPAKRDYEMLEFQRFVKTHKLPFKMNPAFPINTLHLMRAAVAAKQLDCFTPYVDAVMAAMWEDAADMEDVGIVCNILENAGLNSAALLALADDPKVKAELTANTETAATRGAFGVPTFFVGEEMFWGKERLGQVAEAIKP